MAREARGPEGRRELTEPFDLVGGTVVGNPSRRGGEHERVAQRLEQIVGEPAGVDARRDRRVDRGDRARRIVARDRLEHLDAPRERRVAEDREHLRGVEETRPERERLVEERERVAVGPGGAPRDERDRLGFGLDAFLLEDPREVTLDLLDREQREVEVLRARTDRGQHPLRLGGREDEHDVRGRLLERLQQRVGRGRAEHVHLVDDVDLALRRTGEAEVDALHEVAHVVDAVVRRRVELGEIEERARRDRDAVLALAAGLPRRVAGRGS